MPKTASTKSLPFEVRPSPIAGSGVFATRRIREGTRLIEYLGARISSEEADRQYDDDGMDEHHTFLFAVDEDTVIDAAKDGNEARFFNHGCAPNCQAVNEDGRIFIESIADIAPGEELVYDYALSRDEPWDPRFRELYACRCGAPGCRGTILAHPKPPRARKSSAKAKKDEPAQSRRRPTKAARSRRDGPASATSSRAAPPRSKRGASARSR